MKAEIFKTKTGERKSLIEVLLRRTKIAVFQTERLLSWVFQPSHWKNLELAGPPENFPHLLYERSHRISREVPGSHPLLEEGKRINLALAAPSFHGLLLEPTRPISFWRNLRRVSPNKGYRAGMELRGGCVVPSLGGGLCLLSNALFEMAAHMGWTILERHGHTMQVSDPEDGELWGLDATLFWPQVDLRFAPTEGRARLEVRVLGDHLVLKVFSTEASKTHTQMTTEGEVFKKSAQGLFRHNRILRKISDKESGQILKQEVIAENNKRVIQSTETRENCLTCGDTACEEKAISLKKIK